jgi:hypothetical protein
MPRTVGGWIQQRSGKLEITRTLQGYVELRGRTTQNSIRQFTRVDSNYVQQFGQRGYGDNSLDCSSQVSGDAKQCGRVIPGFIKDFGRSGMGDAQHLERTTPSNIKCGRSVAGYCKVEFGRLIMGCLSYETGRVVGGIRKVNVNRQVPGNLNSDLSRTQYGDVKQFGRIVPASGREFGRVSPNTIQCGRVFGGIIQSGHTTPSY